MEEQLNVLCMPNVAGPVTELTTTEREARILKFARQIESDELAQRAYGDKSDVCESQHRWDFDGLDYSFDEPIVEVSDTKLEQVVERIASDLSDDDGGVAAIDLTYPVAFALLNVWENETDDYDGLAKTDNIRGTQHIYMGDFDMSDTPLVIGHPQMTYKEKRKCAREVLRMQEALETIFEDFQVIPISVYQVR